MTAWEIALRVLFGWGILLAGGLLYFLARYMIEEGKDVSWAEVFVYLIILFIGFGIMSVGDKILAWQTIPSLIRWIVIGFFLAASVVCYLRLILNVDEMSNTEALVLYLTAFGLFSLGMRLAFLEFEH